MRRKKKQEKINFENAVSLAHCASLALVQAPIQQPIFHPHTFLALAQVQAQAQAAAYWLSMLVTINCQLNSGIRQFAD